MKSKQELIEEWESAIEAAEFYGKGKEERLISYMKDFVSDLKQLDEPEVLSWEWQEITFEQAYDKLREESILSEKSFGYYWNCINDNVEIDEPGNLLVPRQELPVIPKFVADWIEENHERNTMIELSHLNDSLSSQNMKKEHKLYFWIKENFDTFAEAWIAYPNVEVEKEQKYYVINNDRRMMLVRMMDGKTITEADPFKLEDMYEVEKKSHRLTEQEIKDYDPRYWEFRKPVEEMEE